MTDFFAQLAARYRGDADVIRPRVPFRFEPVQPLLAAADLTGEAAAEPTRSGAYPERPHRRADGPAGPGLRDDLRRGSPARGPAADAGDAGPEPGRTVAPGPRSARPARRPRQPVAATERAPSGTGRAAPGGTGQGGPAAPVSVAASRRAASRPAMSRPAASRAGRTAARDASPVASALEPATPPEPAMSRKPATAPEPAVASGTRAVRRRSQSAGGSDELGAGAARDASRSPQAAVPTLRPAPRVSSGGRTGAGPDMARPGRSSNRWPQAHPASGPLRAGQENITVQVTIGRVEVRAAASPAGPAAAEQSASPRAAGPSLADYLRSKSRSAAVLP